MGLNKLIEYLREIPVDNLDSVIDKFQEYHEILYTENQKINLVSRKTSKEDYWTIHMLDSILPAKYFNFNNSKVLDFGTGGGLPGIPLKIVFPQSSIYMMDSRKKKITAVESFIKKLDLRNCFTIVSRLEEIEKKWYGKFDYILCRSVKITPLFAKYLFKLLANNGTIILYKSIKLDDLNCFNNYKIIDVSHDMIGIRKLIVIKKR